MVQAPTQDVLRDVAGIDMTVAVEGCFAIGMPARTCAAEAYQRYQQPRARALATALWSVYTALTPADLLDILLSIYCADPEGARRACTEVTTEWHDVLVRDALDDAGLIPYPKNDVAGSPDVWPAGTVPLPEPKSLLANWTSKSPFNIYYGSGAENFVYVRATNLFPGATPWYAPQGNLVPNTVTLYWSKASLLLDPRVWATQQIRTKTGDSSTLPAASAIGDHVVTQEPFRWVVPENIRNEHFCLIALVHTASHPNPPPTIGGITDFAAYVKSHPNVAWRNLAVVYLGGGAEQRLAESLAAERGLSSPVYEVDLALSNPDPEERRFALRLSATALPPGSEVALRCSEYPHFDLGPVTVGDPLQWWPVGGLLPPGAETTLTMAVTLRDPSSIGLEAGVSLVNYVEAEAGSALHEMATEPRELGLTAEQMGFTSSSRGAFLGNYEVEFRPGVDPSDRPAG